MIHLPTTPCLSLRFADRHYCKGRTFQQWRGYAPVFPERGYIFLLAQNPTLRTRADRCMTQHRKPHQDSDSNTRYRQNHHPSRSLVNAQPPLLAISPPRAIRRNHRQSQRHQPRRLTVPFQAQHPDRGHQYSEKSHP